MPLFLLNNVSLSDLLLLIGLSFLWGASFLFIKVAVLEMPPLALASYRLALGALGLAAYVAAGRLLRKGFSNCPGSGGAPLLGRRLWLPSLVLAFFGAVLPYVLIAWGELYISSGAAAILNSTSPLFSALFSRWRLWGVEEPLSFPGVVGLLLGAIGVAVLVAGAQGFQGFEASGMLELLGYGAVLAGSASYAVGGLYARRAFAGTPPVAPALGQNLAGTLMALPLGLTVARPERWPSPAAAGSVLALGLGGTALAYLLYYRLLARVGATRTLSVTYLLPATALVYGAVLLSEQVTLPMLAGLALILLGVSLVTDALPRLLPRRS